MNINLTLAIQMCNFIVAYMIVRKFFFQPAVTIIEHEAAEKKFLLTVIAQQKQSLEIQKKACQKQWHECRNYFVQHHPVPMIEQCAVSKFFFPQVSYKEISQEEVVRHYTEVKTALEEKIKHVWS